MAYEIATYDEIRNKSLGVGFLVMDDLATEDIKGKGAIGYVLSKRHDMRRPTVITTNLTLEDIRDKYGERVYERLQDGANGNVFIISSGAYRSYEEDWVK
jgi:DNA replication protein DnaC